MGALMEDKKPHLLFSVPPKLLFNLLGNNNKAPLTQVDVSLPVSGPI